MMCNVLNVSDGARSHSSGNVEVMLYEYNRECFVLEGVVYEVTYAIFKIMK